MDVEDVAHEIYQRLAQDDLKFLWSQKHNLIRALKLLEKKGYIV